MANIDLDLEPDWADDDEWIDDMSALRPQDTGVDNTVKVGGKGKARHPARILVAIDPPHNLDRSRGWWASVAVHDGGIRYRQGSPTLPSHVERQAQAFVKLNRVLLERHWENEVYTAELLAELRPVDPHHWR